MPSTNTLAKAALVAAFITPLLEPLNDVGVGAGSAKGQTVRYVSPTSSGPSATGTQADPWSLAELQTAINNDLIPANTEVRFERDQVFEGTLTIYDLNGTEGSPIKFLADPTSSGALPIFSGSKVVPANSWTSYATSPIEIWQVHLNAIGVSDVFNVYDGGELMTVAREPDAGFHRATTFSPGSGTLSSDDLASDPIDWTGGGVLVIRHVNWSYMNRLVTSDAGTSIGYPAISANTGGTDWGFYLQNKLEALDTPGEWYLAGAGGSDPVLYYAPLTSGQPQNVRIADRQRGIQVWPTESGCSYLEFRDLVFEHYADAYYRLNSDPNPLGVGIKIKSGSHHITVDHCTFRDLRIGIDDQDNPENRPHHNNYTNNTFERIYRNALKLNSDVATVQYNSITEVGRWSGQAGNDYGGNTALFSTGDDVDISWNTLSELGGAGIGLNGMRLTATRHIVEHNSIRNASLDLNDHGAITFDKCEALTIRYNVIDGMQPFTASSATDGNSSDRTVGIYFGEGRIVDVHVEHNTITGCGTGILLDHTYQTAGIKITANTIFNCRDAQLAMQDYGIRNSPGAVAPYYWPGYNSVFEGNILYSLSADSWSLYQKHDYSTSFSGTYGLVDYGTFKSNHYFNPFNCIAVEQYIRYDVTGNPPLSNYIGIDDRAIPWSLNGWRTMAQHGDPTGVGHPLRLPGYRLDPGTPPVAVGFHTDECSAMYPWNATAGPFTGNGADGSYLSFANLDYMERWGAGLGSLTPIVTGSAISPPGTYRFHVRMRSANTDALQLGPIFDTQTNTMPLPHAHFALTPGWGEEDLILEIPEGYDMVTAFQNVHRAYGAISASDVDIDYVRVDRVALDPTYADEIALHHILRYNCPIADPTDQNVGASFNVPGDPGECWSDVHGNFYAAGDQIPLDEWASIILFRMDVPTAPLTFNSGVYDVTADQQWTENWNIAGSVVVHDGTTLTIDGAHIGFAASTQSLTTNITVQPGGTLILRNGATLRNWMGCGSAPEMWDGVKVLGNGTTAGAGLVRMESGARITDALTAIRCAEGQPNSIFGGDAQAGGVVQATNAVFENNLYDIVTRPHTVVDQAEWGPSSFTHCTFRRTRPLHDQQLPPGARVSLMQSASTPFTSCTFENTTGDYKGMGIHAIGTRVRVEGGEAPQARSRFSGLDFAMLHSAYDPTHLADVDRSDFTDNKRGLMIWGADNCKVTRSTFTVADAPTNYSGIDGVYGAYLYGCSGFEVEENTFTGTGTEHPKVGLVLRNTGTADNQFYNNTFSGFADAGERSCGTVIMGQNATADLSVGLRIKCNDYSANATNNYDVAFTGNAVSIADQQGLTGQGTTYPAGNTFALVDPLTCNGNEARHLYEDVEFALNAFSYYHHLPQAQLELVPQCNNVQVSPQNTFWFYSKPTSCPVDLSSLVPIGDDESTAGGAHAEHDVLVAVYDNWKDGGNTDGLIEFIKDPGNSSYAVRNQLMLVAPKVSYAAWKECFIRTPAMNPWHLAQALLANSPLEPATLTLLQQSDIDPFYKELVEDGQNGGQSMHSIYKSEIAHFHGVKSGALQAAVRKSLLSSNNSDVALTLRALQDYPITGGEQVRFALLLATNDLATARDVVDERLLAAKEDKDLWQVYDLLLGLREQSKAPSDLDGSGISQLQSIAANGGMGAAQAEAWLTLLGNPTTEVVLLPNRNKSLKPQRERPAISARPLLAAYPNPSNGPVYITYTVLDGVENVELHVHDAQGRLLKRQRVGNTNGIAELQPRELSTGVHVASLYFDGIRVGSAKLNIVK